MSFGLRASSPIVKKMLKINELRDRPLLSENCKRGVASMRVCDKFGDEGLDLFFPSMYCSIRNYNARRTEWTD
jgi:hypothetical protein